MIRKTALLTLMVLASFATNAGVKVTSLGLTTDGPNGFITINLNGRSHELPDVKVNKNIIEVTLSDAEAFNAINKSIKGADLFANSVNGKAVIKAVLPYEVSSGVNLGFKGKDIEVIFPRGTVTKTEKAPATVAAPVREAPKKIEAPKKTENKVLAKVEENNSKKEALNEDYLNKLVKEENTKNKPQEKEAQGLNKDEIKVQQAALQKTPAAPAKKQDNFSFTGYAVKFTIFLAMVLGLFYGVVQLLKKGVFNRGKLGFLNNAQMIQVLSTTYVAPKRSLMVVKAHNQIFLVANSESGLQFLSEMTDTTGLIKEGEKQVTGTNFDLNLGKAEETTSDSAFKLKENINESTPFEEKKGIQNLSAKDIVKFSDELKKKAKKLKPIEFN